MKNIRYVGVDEIAERIREQGLDRKPLYPLIWDKEEFDGGVMEEVFGDMDGRGAALKDSKKTWIRVSVDYKKKEVVFVSKKSIDKVLKNMKAKPIRLRMAQRAKSDRGEDYLEYYYDILDEHLKKIKNLQKEYVTNCYVNFYDYVLNYFADEKEHRKLMSQNLPTHEVM